MVIPRVLLLKSNLPPELFGQPEKFMSQAFFDLYQFLAGPTEER